MPEWDFPSVPLISLAARMDTELEPPPNAVPTPADRAAGGLSGGGGITGQAVRRVAGRKTGLQRWLKVSLALFVLIHVPVQIFRLSLCHEQAKKTKHRRRRYPHAII